VPNSAAAPEAVPEAAGAVAPDSAAQPVSATRAADENPASTIRRDGRSGPLSELKAVIIYSKSGGGHV
jgi:hypothetical protein